MVTTTSRQNSSGFFIGVGCPGCGAVLALDEGFFVTSCSYCGSVLRVLMPEIPPAFMVKSGLDTTRVRFHLDRHLKNHNQPLTGSDLQFKRIYYPYWKVDASLLKARNRIEERVYVSEAGSESQTEHVDRKQKTDIRITPYTVTVAAGAPLAGLPDSLGVRSESIRMVPFSQDNLEGDFDALPVLRSWDQIRSRIVQAVARMNEINPAAFGRNITRLFTPEFSLVYFPFYAVESYEERYRRFLLDGLTGRVLSTGDPVEQPQPVLNIADGQQAVTEPQAARPPAVVDRISFAEDDVPLEPPEFSPGELNVDFHRCTNCGVDLPAVQSCVYYCRNCKEMQILERSEISSVTVEMAGDSAGPDDRLVPFWWLTLSGPDAGRLGKLFGSLKPVDRLVIPAFETAHFDGMYKLSRRITAAFDKLPRHRTQALDDRCIPVQVRPAQAVANAEIIICREMLERGLALPDETTSLRTDQAGLVYVPFHLENYFYMDSVLNAITLERVLID
ncbi:MAG: hypothetical protein KKA42_10915 [candidate division Zixibacteria bacterium]|nr:hypothetical protein [candidate division Zixibacteria bacterium]